MAVRAHGVGPFTPMGEGPLATVITADSDLIQGAARAEAARANAGWPEDQGIHVPAHATLPIPYDGADRTHLPSHGPRHIVVYTHT